MGEGKGVQVDSGKVPIYEPTFQKILESSAKSVTTRGLGKAGAVQCLHWQ